MEKLHPSYSVDALADAPFDGLRALSLSKRLEVSKSGFHAHRLKPRRPRAQRDAALAPLIASSHSALSSWPKGFAASRKTYGCRRVRADLAALGQRCGKNRLARLMRQARLCPRQKRRFRPTTTESRHDHAIAENWLAKVPTPERPGMVWQSDFTYIETGEGWLYLAFTLDACPSAGSGP